MDSLPISAEEIASLEILAQTANEKLTTAGQDSANKAFNLGCSVGLLPASLLIILTLIITRGSWIATGFIAGLMAIGLLAFANLSAYISRSRAYTRAYQQEILPEVENELNRIGLDYSTFEKVAARMTPPEAPLQAYLTHVIIDEEPAE